MIYRMAYVTEIGELLKMIDRFCSETGVNGKLRATLIRSVIANDQIKTIVAVDGLSVAGMIAFSVEDEEINGHMLYVKPEHRGRIVAGRLLQEAKREGKRRGGNSFFFFVDNSRYEMYLKCGYRPVAYRMKMEV